MASEGTFFCVVDTPPHTHTYLLPFPLLPVSYKHREYLNANVLVAPALHYLQTLNTYYKGLLRLVRTVR